MTPCVLSCCIRARHQLQRPLATTAGVKPTRRASLAGGYPVVEVLGNQTVQLLTSPQPSQYSFDCVAGETFSQEALFEGTSR